MRGWDACWKVIPRSPCEFGRSTPSERNTIGRCAGALSSIDSIFAHDFRVAVCSWCARGGGGRPALSSNITSGLGLHGFCADRGHAFQSIRRLVARSTQPSHGFEAFASPKIGRWCDRVLLFADQALHRCDPLFSRISPGNFSDWRLDRSTRKRRSCAICFGPRGHLLGGRIRSDLRDAGF